MAGSGDQIQRWETQADVDACLEDIGVTMDQVRRWRREGLLPPVKQEPQAYRGSVVPYPVGTCLQIRLVQKLLAEKDSLDYVRRQLWRYGGWVKEDYWRARLRYIAGFADRVLPIISWLRVRADRNETAPTLPEKAAQYRSQSIIFSRIQMRLQGEDLAIFYRVLLELSFGEYSGFETPSRDEKRSRDEASAIKAFDLGYSERQFILGTNINFLEALPSTLGAVSAALSSGSFDDAANAPTDEIAQARGDAKNALQIAICLYEPLKWIYGDGAFGLRLVAWIARKTRDPMFDGLILCMLRLRKVPDAILPSEKIAEMARQALEVMQSWQRIKWLYENDPRYSEVLKPKRIKAALVDKIALKCWREEVRRASIRKLVEPKKLLG